MLRGSDIKRLIRLLKARKVTLFHACQFADFRSYLSLGGIPSRACLAENGLAFTQFETDEDDQAKDVWDKIFMNFSDFGTTFAKGHNAVPNPYGPILLKINPLALSEALDVAICFQPVGGNNFNRETCALKTVEDVDSLFAHPIESQYPLSTWIKYKEALRKEHQCFKVCDPDISCTTISGKVSLMHINSILVDPYFLINRSLQTLVSALVASNGLQIPVYSRFSCRKELYSELAHHIARNIPSCYELAQNSCLSKGLRLWAREICNQNLEYQFNRFATYLRNGTLLELL